MATPEPPAAESTGIAAPLAPVGSVGFDIVTARPTLQLVGQTETQDVMEVWVSTTPSGIQYPLRVANNQFSADLVRGLAGLYAPTIEDWMAQPEIVWVSYLQDATPAGDVQDKWRFTVQSTSGKSQRDIDLSFAYLQFGASVYPITQAARAELDRLEG